MVLRSGRAGLVASSQLRPALALLPASKLSTLRTALVKAAHEATGLFFSSRFLLDSSQRRKIKESKTELKER
jgi:hypothetical protein